MGSGLSVPDHCLSFHFNVLSVSQRTRKCKNNTVSSPTLEPHHTLLAAAAVKIIGFKKMLAGL